MPIDRDKFIGVESEDRYVDVDKGLLKLFAQATGELDPIYWDNAAAQAAGHPAALMPPTYTFSLGLLAPAAVNPVMQMGVNVATGLHGEQHFTYHKPIYAGDRIRLRSKIVDVYEKKGGALEFVVEDTTAHNQDGELCVSARTVMVFRN